MSHRKEYPTSKEYYNWLWRAANEWHTEGVSNVTGLGPRWERQRPPLSRAAGNWPSMCFLKLLRAAPQLTFRAEAGSHPGKKVSFSGKTGISLGPSYAATLIIGALSSRLALFNWRFPGENAGSGETKTAIDV